MEAANWFTWLGANSLWLSRSFMQCMGGERALLQGDAVVLSISGSAQYLSFFPPSTIANTLYHMVGANIPTTNAAVGWGFALDFLFFDNMVYPFFAHGATIGTGGHGVSIEVGPVFDIFEPDDYQGPFMTASFGGGMHVLGTGFAKGFSGSTFVTNPGLMKGSWGWSMGPSLSSGSGVSFSTAFLEYTRLRGYEYPASALGLASLSHGFGTVEELSTFVTQNGTGLARRLLNTVV
jgi:hypothetical protein